VSDKFSARNGLKQEDALSLLLFNLIWNTPWTSKKIKDWNLMEHMLMT